MTWATSQDYISSILRDGSWLEGKLGHPALFLNRKAVAACLLQYPVNVVFHGLRREVQLRGNLFIRQALSDHGNELLFAPRQRETCAKTEIGRPRWLLGKMREQA